MNVAMIFAGLGALFSFVVLRWQPRDSEVPTAVMGKLKIAALVGALLGAHGLEWPAEVFGWAPPAPPHFAWSARTVLGALLGGWLAVEVSKIWLNYRAPTGDRFALPLALALGIGRLGCVVGGCCPGVPIEATSAWATVSRALQQEPRFPATLIEAYFHLAAAGLILFWHRRGSFCGARLAAYLTLYSAFRFILEMWRDVPRPFFGWSYYQILALALFMLAGSTLISRVVFRRPSDQA